MKNEKIVCFNPIIDKDSEIIILGSMPSKKSREYNFYYGNPTNRFWMILSEIYDKKFTNEDINTKISLLHDYHIALFDVYASCEMKKEGSSLDSNITNQTFNDIFSLITGTKIRKIFITSKKAYNDFIKHFAQFFDKENIKIINLPSPSSANRSKYKTDSELVAIWAKLLKSN